MKEEEIDDVLFDIDMQLYDEFNDKMCEINEHLGDVYSNKDLEDIKEAENAKERKLLREAVKQLQKEKNEINKLYQEANDKCAEYEKRIEELEVSDASKEASSMKYYNLYKELKDSLKRDYE